MELVDIGANLGHESFDRDREQVLTRAREAGVAQIVVTGASEAESRTALAVAHTAPGVLFATAGVHPPPREGVVRGERRGAGASGRSARGRRDRGDGARLQSRLLAAPGSGAGARSPPGAGGGAPNSRVPPRARCARAVPRHRLAVARPASACGHPLLHRRWSRARRLSRSGPPRRGDGLDLRRAPADCTCARSSGGCLATASWSRRTRRISSPGISCPSRRPAATSRCICPTSCGRWPAPSDASRTPWRGPPPRPRDGSSGYRARPDPRAGPGASRARAMQGIFEVRAGISTFRLAGSRCRRSFIRSAAESW